MDHEDASMLLVTKEAELNGLRQQLQQITEDFRRTLTALSGKDAEIERLDGTVNALREMMAEKDALFGQFQQQVQEMEASNMRDAQRCTELEQQLAQQEQQWQQSQEANELDRDAEVQQLRQQLLDTEARWSEQLPSVRQEAMEEQAARTSQLQAQIQGAADAELSVRRELEACQREVLLKQEEADEAQRQLTGTLESLQRLEESHKKALQAKEDHIRDLQARITHLASNSTTAVAEHESHMNQLISGLNQMKESCTKQAAESAELSADVRRLQEEKRALKDAMRALEAQATKLETERNVLEAALQHEVTGQASAQAELNIFKAKLHEAVAELEKRTAAAEGRAGQLMRQLVAERGRLVDAVVEQANSSSPALAAELAKSLEADRRQTQSELQRAQERASSLQEDLSLIRSTLLPLVMAHSNEQPEDGPAASMAQSPGALLLQQRQQRACQLEQQQRQAMWSDGISGHLQHESSRSPSPCGHTCMHQEAALAASPCGQHVQDCAPGSFHQQQPNSPHAPYTPNTSHPMHQPAMHAASSCYTHSAQTPYNSPAVHHSNQSPRCVHADSHGCFAANQHSLATAMPHGMSYHATATSYSSPAAHLAAPHTAGLAAATAASPSTLAGLVTELQADVDKLQQQLHTSRRQLDYGLGPDGQHRHSPHILPIASQSHGPSPIAPSRAAAAAATAAAAMNGSPATSDKELTQTLRYLMSRAEQLSAENGQLRCQLSSRAGADAAGAAGGGDISGSGGRDSSLGLHANMATGMDCLRARSASPLRGIDTDASPLRGQSEAAYEQLLRTTDRLMLQTDERAAAAVRSGLGTSALASAYKAARTASKLRHKAAIDSITSRHSLNRDAQALDALLGSSSGSRGKLGKALGQLLMSPGADRVQRLKGTSRDTLRRLAELSPVRRHLLSLSGHEF